MQRSTPFKIDETSNLLRQINELNLRITELEEDNYILLQENNKNDVIKYNAYTDIYNLTQNDSQNVSIDYLHIILDFIDNRCIVNINESSQVLILYNEYIDHSNIMRHNSLLKISDFSKYMNLIFDLAEIDGNINFVGIRQREIEDAA